MYCQTCLWAICAFLVSLAALLPIIASLPSPHHPSFQGLMAGWPPLLLCGMDLLFALAVVAFLQLGLIYNGVYVSPGVMPTYPGPWRVRYKDEIKEKPPFGFSSYLKFALAMVLFVPLCGLVYGTVGTTKTREEACCALLPLLLNFLVQMWLETRTRFGKSWLMPAIPLLFYPHRAYQLARALLRFASSPWLRYLLISQLCFWTFDFCATVLWLPWMLNCNLITADPPGPRT
eukprot:g61256.t1